VALYVAFLAGADLSLFSGPRMIAGTALVLGFAACALSGGTTEGRAFTVIAAVLGPVALIAAVATLITGNGILLGVLVGAAVALWLITTVHHTLPGSGRVTDRDLHRLIQEEKQSRPRG